MFVKNGMGGSRCGRSRHEPTIVLKTNSKHARRQMDLDAIREQLDDTVARSMFEPDPYDVPEDNDCWFDYDFPDYYDDDYDFQPHGDLGDEETIQCLQW